MKCCISSRISCSNILTINLLCSKITHHWRCTRKKEKKENNRRTKEKEKICKRNRQDYAVAIVFTISEISSCSVLDKMTIWSHLQRKRWIKSAHVHPVLVSVAMHKYVSIYSVESCEGAAKIRGFTKDVINKSVGTCERVVHKMIETP